MLLTTFKLLVTVGGLALASGALAAPITYKGSQQVGPVTANYSFTTDGGVGQLAANFINYSINLSDGTSSYTLTPDNSYALSYVSANDKFLYIDTGYLDVLSFARVPINGFGQTAGGFGVTEDQTGVSLASSSDPGFYVVNHDNAAGFAYADGVTSAVPEPATWGMMIFGMGAIGIAMRRRQKVSTRVSFT
jgi:hypothetical protein